MRPPIVPRTAPPTVGTAAVLAAAVLVGRANETFLTALAPGLLVGRATATGTDDFGPITSGMDTLQSPRRRLRPLGEHPAAATNVRRTPTREAAA